jgi:hypothetical protein
MVMSAAAIDSSAKLRAEARSIVVEPLASPVSPFPVPMW